METCKVHSSKMRLQHSDINRFVYVVSPLGAKAELPWTMKPRQRSHHDPTVTTQPAPVGRAAPCKMGINPSGARS